LNAFQFKTYAALIRLEDWTIAQRWHGVYSKHSALPYFENTPLPGVKIVTGLGGGGMTLAFGLAKRIRDTLG
jgi:glycine/D-amino acid oxidase-like deaminating enzyme